MSGTYPPYDYGGQRPTYGEEPGYGEDPRYGGGRGYEDADERGYQGHRSDHDQSGYPAYPGYEPTIPAQGYPTHDADPYGGGPAYPNSPGYPPPSRYEGYHGYSERQDHWNDQEYRHGRRADEMAPAPGRPGSGRFAPAGPPSAPAKRRGRGMAIALSVTGVVLALLALGGWFVGRPLLAQWPATLSKPERLAGLERSTEPALQQAADEIAADIRKDVKVDEAIAAFYHDPAKAEKIVALVGGTAFLASPKAELDEAFRSARGEGMSIGEVVPVNAGPLGGLARCAPAEQKGEGDAKVPLSVCAWADHGSLLIGLFFHRPVDESAALLRTIRSEMLKR